MGINELVLIGTSALTVLSYVVGFTLPAIIRLINKDIVDSDERLIATYLICFFAAMIIDWHSFQTGDITHLLAWFALVSQEAHASFKLYFQGKWEDSPKGASV